jgi:hypothetical protein
VTEKPPPFADRGPRVRPLLVRPGARFACAGDGICCTDVHALGPLTRTEARRLRVIGADTVVRHAELEAPVFRTVAGGGCIYLRPGRCQLHADHGADAKPDGCRRFPFGLVATPRGGRITTEHRCPCRTMGARPPLDAATAEPSLRDNAGRVWAELYTPRRVPLDAHQRVAWSTYEAIESQILARLERGDAIHLALGTSQLPRVRGGWRAVAHWLRSERDGTGYGETCAWAGDALLSLHGERKPLRPRPWTAGFDRAERRTRVAGDPDAIFRDWVADKIWSLSWTEFGSFDRGRHELAARVTIAREMSRLLRRAGVRRDRAAAESVLVVELAGCGESWEKASRALVLPARRRGWPVSSPGVADRSATAARVSKASPRKR